MKSAGKTKEMMMTKVEMLLATVTLSADVSYDNAYVKTTLGDLPSEDETLAAFEQPATTQADTQQIL